MDDSGNTVSCPGCQHPADVRYEELYPQFLERRPAPATESGDAGHAVFSNAFHNTFRNDTGIVTDTSLSAWIRKP